MLRFEGGSIRVAEDRLPVDWRQPVRSRLAGDIQGNGGGRCGGGLGQFRQFVCL